MALPKIRKALQRWKGPTTDMQKILSDNTHKDYEKTISLTKQSQAAEADIHNIIKLARNGVVEHVNTYEARYGDATAVDLRTSLELVKETNNWFGKLPIEVRNHFKNDPIQAIALLDDVRAGNESAIKLGQSLGIVERFRNDEQTSPDVKAEIAAEKAAESPPA